MGQLLSFRRASKSASRQARLERAKMYKLVQDIHTQSDLTNVLLEMRNPTHRRIFYSLIAPSIKKFVPEYPDWVARFDPDLKPVIGKAEQ